MMLGLGLLFAGAVVGLTGNKTVTPSQLRVPTAEGVIRNVNIGRCIVTKDRANSVSFIKVDTADEKRTVSAQNKFMRAFNSCAYGVKVAFPRIVSGSVAEILVLENNRRLLRAVNATENVELNSLLPAKYSEYEKYVTCLIAKQPSKAADVVSSEHGSISERLAVQSLVRTGGCSDLKMSFSSIAAIRAEIAIALYRRATAIVS